jgi:DNA-binding transcriptional LysR family regulator
VALRLEVGMPQRLMRELSESVLDIAVIYQPELRPGLVVEPLLEDRLVLVTTDATRPLGEHYIFVDWGEAFRQMHAASMPELHSPGVTLNLGALGVNYLLNEGGAAYFPERIIKPHLDQKLLSLVDDAPDFPYPAYVVYQEDFSAPKIMESALSSLREVAELSKNGHLPMPFWA